MPEQILLLSPYDALSHARWRSGMVAHLPEYEFQQIVLPPRYFSWRFRGNSLTLAHNETLKRAQTDLILATSMTDLATLKGMRPELAGIPAVLYFHENQFAWPGNDDPHVLDRQLTSLYSAIAADKLVFNSDFNRTTFLDGVDRMLARMPDHVPRGIVQALRDRSTVIPVPLEDHIFQGDKPSDRFSIVWNHRWEFDKGPGRLRDIVRQLDRTPIDFTVHLLGQQFRNMPDEMKDCVDLLAEGGHLGHSGFIEDRDEYLRVLRQSQVVLSTAHHEFQGIAVLEAVASGCAPLVPDELVYRELFDNRYRYRETADAVDCICECAQRFDAGESLEVPDVFEFSWQRQRESWQNLLKGLI